MPYKSQAQRRKFHALLREGKISPRVVEKFDRESLGLRLPERVGKKQVKVRKVKVIR